MALKTPSFSPNDTLRIFHCHLYSFDGIPMRGCPGCDIRQCLRRVAFSDYPPRIVEHFAQPGTFEHQISDSPADKEVEAVAEIEGRPENPQDSYNQDAGKYAEQIRAHQPDRAPDSVVHSELEDRSFLSGIILSLLVILL